jgi:Alpha-L-fucosidase
VFKRAFAMAVVTAAAALAALVPTAAGDPPDYTPDPASLRQHKVPTWFEDAKLGYFIHWRPYSVPAYAPPSGGHQYAEWYGAQPAGQPNLRAPPHALRRGLPL